MTKKVLPWIIVGVLVVGLCFSAYGYFATQADLKAKQAQYDAYRKLSIAEEAAKDARIAGLQSDNANLRKINGVLNGQVVVDDQIIASDRQTIAFLRKNEPATTPEIEKLPIVINLRAQIVALNAGFVDAQKEVADVKLVNLNLVAQLGNDEKIITDVNAKYNAEHAMRLSCEALSAAYKKAITPSFFGLIIKDWKQELVVAAVAGLAGHFLK